MYYKQKISTEEDGKNRTTKDEKKSEKTREWKESKGTRVIRPFWFGVVGLILSMAALLYWFFAFSLR